MNAYRYFFYSLFREKSQWSHFNVRNKQKSAIAQHFKYTSDVFELCQEGATKMISLLICSKSLEQNYAPLMGML